MLVMLIQHIDSSQFLRDCVAMNKVKNIMFLLNVIFLLQSSLLLAADVAQRPAFGFSTKVITEVGEEGECDVQLVIATEDNKAKKKKKRRKRSKQKRKNERRKKKNKAAVPSSVEEGELVDCEYCGKTHDINEFCRPFCDNCYEYHEEGECLLIDDEDSEWEQLPEEVMIQPPMVCLAPSCNFGVGIYCEMCHRALPEQCRQHSEPRLVWSPFFNVNGRD